MNREQALISLQAFLPDDKEIIRIINFCDLDPIGGWRIWQNQYSPYIRVQKNKKIMLYHKHENFFVTSKDLYAYSSIDNIAEISKKLLFTISKNQRCFLFWGIDDKLRCRISLEKRYFNEAPLSMPLEDIRTLLKHEFVDDCLEVQLKKIKGWIINLPPKKDLQKIIPGINIPIGKDESNRH